MTMSAADKVNLFVSLEILFTALIFPRKFFYEQFFFLLWRCSVVLIVCNFFILVFPYSEAAEFEIIYFKASDLKDFFFKFKLQPWI